MSKRHEMALAVQIALKIALFKKSIAIVRAKMYIMEYE